MVQWSSGLEMLSVSCSVYSETQADGDIMLLATGPGLGPLSGSEENQFWEKETVRAEEQQPEQLQLFLHDCHQNTV